jgi:SAM-dependent methyltransferase
MALTPLTTAKLLPMLKPGHRVAAMGYPDMIAPPAMFERALGERFAEVTYRPDSEAICKRHGLPQRPIPDAKSVFELLGAKLDVFDIVQERGDEILCDLNDPLDRYAEYDFVLDVGTLEHCFNIGQAGRNMAGLLKDGGVIFHGNPHNSGNHGFYGLQPTWYADFYGQDGFELLYCVLQQRGTEEQLEPTLTGRFSLPAAEVNIFAAARRTAILPIQWVTQTKYKSLIGAKHGT